MSRRKGKSRQRRRKKLAPPARFPTGTPVRVKRGTKDPDYPDMPIGGWSGIIRDIDAPFYRIEWDRRTREAMHPIYRKRCARDGADPESMWLGEEDLEADTGEPLPIEQPTAIITRPLRMDEREDRIRAIFGLTSDDPVPEPSPVFLAEFHRHLVQHLDFPFEARFEEHPDLSTTVRHRVQVTALLDPEEADEETGLQCTATKEGEQLVLPLAELAVIAKGTNRKLVEDYAYWFGEGQRGAYIYVQDFLDSVAAPAGRPPLKSLIVALSQIALAGGAYGTVIGAACAALDHAAVASGTAALVLALAGGLLGLVRHPGEKAGVLAAALIATVGGLLGALAGAMVIAWPGALPGVLVGLLLLRIFWRRLAHGTGPVLLPLLGGMIGTAAYAWMTSPEEFWSGAWIGALTGLIAGPSVILATGLLARPVYSE